MMQPIKYYLQLKLHLPYLQLENKMHFYHSEATTKISAFTAIL